MESQFCFLLLIFFLFSSWLCFAKPKNKAKIQIPGPWKLPLLGNLHQLAAARSSLPHHMFHELSLKYGPLMHLQLGELSTVIVSSPEIAQQIMKTHDLAFVNRPQLLSSQIMGYGSSDIVFAPYGDYWKHMRRICTSQLFTAKKVQSFSSVREDEVSKLIESVGKSVGSEFDLTSKIYSLTSAIITRVAFGGDKSKREKFQQLIDTAINSGFGFVDLFPSMRALHFITGVEAKLAKVRTEMDEFLEEIIRENQEKQFIREGKGSSEPENLLQVLLQIQRNGNPHEIPITTDNIKAVIADIFSGGTETSAATMEWAMLEMMRNPKVVEKARAEIRETFKGKEVIHDSDMEQLGYLKAVIKETLRLHPPLPLLIPRECREACKINGYEIPIKTKVMINAWAIGRDPKRWNESEEFIPERFHGNCNDNIDFKGANFGYIPFGAGRRICPGISFGLASIELPLASLLYHFDWELPHGMKPEDLDMTETFGMAARRKNKLFLIPTPCKHGDS